MEATWALIVMLLLMLGLFLIVAFFAIGMRDRRIVLDGGERLRTRESSSVKMEKAQKEGALRVEEVSEMKIVEEGKTCAICLEPLEVGTTARKLHCGHPFHADCLTSWWSRCIKSENDTRCPLCRESSPFHPNPRPSPAVGAPASALVDLGGEELIEEPIEELQTI